MSQKNEEIRESIGLYRAKRLMEFCKGRLYVDPGTEKIQEADELYYSDNTFIIELPIKP